MISNRSSRNHIFQLLLAHKRAPKILDTKYFQQHGKLYCAESECSTNTQQTWNNDCAATWMLPTKIGDGKMMCSIDSGKTHRVEGVGLTLQKWQMIDRKF